MERRDSGLYQVLYVNGKEKEIHRFDITFGLKHAQTFLTWEGDQTFELPVTPRPCVSFSLMPTQDTDLQRFFLTNV